MLTSQSFRLDSFLDERLRSRMEQSGKVDLDATIIRQLEIIRWVYVPGLAAITMYGVVEAGTTGFIWGNWSIFPGYLLLGLLNTIVQPSETIQAKAKSAAIAFASWFVGNLAWWAMYGLAFVL